jgi:hypothetical protein
MNFKPFKFIVLSLVCLSVVAGCIRMTHLKDKPRAVALVSSDIKNFWEAFDEAQRSEDPVAVMQEHYLDRGSPGLQDFVKSRIESAKDLWAVVKTHETYYNSIRSITLSVEQNSDIKEKIYANFEAVEELYPEAKFVDVYFLIGRMNSGGTTSNRGLLLGTEFFGKTATTPLEELDSWEKAVIKPLEQLPFLVTHELIHVLQYQAGANLSDDTLLDMVLIEGSADFITMLATGETPKEPYFNYGTQHEAELWAEFSKDMNDKKDATNWLYQGSKATTRPADLGYFIGYRILEAYYQKAADKAQALKDILRLEDSKAILAGSGYAPQ